MDAIKRNGSPLPEFETDKEHSYFISRIFVHPAFISDVEDEKKIGKTEVINPENGKTEVINPKKGKIEVITEVINDGINRLRGENDGINDGIKSKLSHIAVKKRERIEKLLEIINENPSMASDLIAIQLGISRPTAERYLAELRRMEIVRREGSNKSGKWRIL